MEYHRFLLAAIVFGSIIAVLIFSKPSITGFVPTSTYSQGLDIMADSSQRFILKSPTGQPLGINSLSLSGVVSGSGLVNIYLSDGQTKLLAFSNKEKIESAMQHITGLAVANIIVEPGQRIDLIESVPDGYKTTSGGFQNECMETCLIDINLGSQAFLDIIVEPGTSVKLTELRFTSRS